MAETNSQAVQEDVKTLQRKSTEGRKGSFQAVADAFKADPTYATAQDVVLWNDPVRSGLVLAIVLLTWFLLNVANYSVVTLIAYLYLGIWAVSFGLVQYSNFSGKPHLLKSRIGEVTDVVSVEEVTSHAQTAYRVVDAVALLARDALFFNDVVFSLKAFGVALGLAILGNIFTLPTLLLIGAILLFTAPRVYKEKGNEIDAAITKVLAMANEKLAPVLAKVPLDKMKLKQE